jgi:hypothetical protein
MGKGSMDVEHRHGDVSLATILSMATSQAANLCLAKIEKIQLVNIVHKYDWHENRDKKYQAKIQSSFVWYRSMRCR